MKVLFIHSQCENGGISRIVFSICDLLKTQGSDGRFVFSRGFIPEDKQDICCMFGNKYEVAWHMLMSRLFDSHCLHSKGATKELISYIEQYNPDIIHLNNIHGYYLNIEIFFTYLKRKRIPVVWTMHDCWAVTGHCSHFEYYDCNRWMDGCSKCKHKDVYPTSWLFCKAERNYQRKQELFTGLDKLHIVVPSNWLFKIIGKSFLKEFPCKVINNGINLKAFRERGIIPKFDVNLNGKEIILAVASVWTKRKGYKDIIQLSQIIDSNKYAIVVIGVTQSQKEELSNYGIYSVLHTKNVEELADWYSYARVFVNPTYEDTFPTVNIESLACGTPVITYNTGGSPEMLTSQCGCIIEKGNVKQLYEAIKSMVKNPVECRNIAENYDSDMKFKEYLSLYHELIYKEA